MKKIFLSCILLVFAGSGLFAGNTFTVTIPEPAIMLLFGTGLLGISGIVRSQMTRK